MYVLEHAMSQFLLPDLGVYLCVKIYPTYQHLPDESLKRLYTGMGTNGQWHRLFFVKSVFKQPRTSCGDDASYVTDNEASHLASSQDRG